MALNKLRLFLTLHAISGLGTSTTTSTTSSSTTTTSSTTTSLPFLPNDCSYCPNCTLVNREHIFGGNSANRHQWPFMVSFGTGNESDWSHFCGGSIISNRTIISAAHCFYSSKSGGYKMGTKIRMGDANLDDATDDGQMARTYTINTILRHPLYRGRGVFHDVAIIFINEEIQFNQQTKPICMTTVPGAQSVEQDDLVEVAGWGYVDDNLNKTASDTLQETTLQVLNRSECKSQSGFDNNLIFCVGNPNGGSSSCKGDSGGPLVTVKSTALGDTFKFLIGILHGSRARCNNATSHYPGVFANLSNPEIFSFVQKWKSLDSLFSDDERTDDEWKELLFTMTNANPTNGNGTKLSDHLLKTRPRIAQMIKDINCDPRFTERRSYYGGCICKLGYAGRTCTTCDHRMLWDSDSNMTTLTDCENGHFVLVTTGEPFSVGQKTEVIDMKNSNFKCPGLPDYPMEMAYGVGGLIGMVPLICGGHKGYFRNSSREFYDDCYKLQQKQWVRAGKLTQARSQMGSGNVVIDNHLFVSGGISGNHRSYSSVNEMIGLQSSSRLKDLPPPKHFNHCNIAFNDTHLMLIAIGGREYFLFNVRTEEFSQAPMLNNRRQNHACVKANIGDKQVALVTGGTSKENRKYARLNSTEYFDLSQPNIGWTYGKELPTKRNDHRMITANDGRSVYIIGGEAGIDLPNDTERTNSILEMKCPDQSPELCFFQNSATQLQYARSGHIALSITPDIAKELCQ